LKTEARATSTRRNKLAITYTPTTNFGAKDSLPTNDPDKVIKGSEFTTEFTALQTAFSLAAPAASPTFTGTVTISSVDINGGTIDGVTIGGSSAGAITGTTGQFNTSLNVDGTVTADGLTVDNSIATIQNSSDGTALRLSSTQNDSAHSTTTPFGEVQFYSGDASSPGASVRATIGGYPFDTAGSGGGVIKIQTADSSSLKDRLSISPVGDISFYEDTGTTPKFFWDASAERLGVGTASPATTLQLLGGTDTALTISKTGDVGNGLQIGRDSTTLAAYIIQRENADLFFRTNNAERLRITSAGNVGIGTSSPSGALHVSRSGLEAGITLERTTSATAKFTMAANDGNLVFTDQNQSAERMRITSAGNVGIGTDSPDTLMELRAANPVLTIRDTETSTASNDARLRLAETRRV
jgi:hypothetical protein